MLSVNTSRIEEWQAAGYSVVDRDQFRYVIESVELDQSGREAFATVCFADGSKLVQPGAGPDGSDVVIDGEFGSGREAWTLRLEDDGAWRAVDAPLIGEVQGTDVCPAA